MGRRYNQRALKLAANYANYANYANFIERAVLKMKYSSLLQTVQYIVES